MTAVAAPTTEYSNQPFSFSEILAPSSDAGDKPDTTEPVKVLASDGVELSIRIYKPPPSTPQKEIALLFYHGGGAYSGGGYQYLAKGLSEQYGVTVYLPDLRGHGDSGGERGDAPSKEQVWRDIDTAVEFVANKHKQQQNKFAGKPFQIYLGGHSSGGGLVVNYATERNDKNNKSGMIEGYVLVSPELGYMSGTARPNRKEFARVNIFAFIANGIFGVLGHNKAVRFNYPVELLQQDKGLVGFNTVNMANAITPETPKEQMASMCTSDDSKPVGLWVGSDDELFDANKVADFVPDTDHNTGTVLPEKNHLGILVDIHEKIGPWITGQK